LHAQAVKVVVVNPLKTYLWNNAMVLPQITVREYCLNDNLARRHNFMARYLSAV
jgi:hypothetical protein